MGQAALIAIDWGTSNLRASLLDASGHTLQTRSASGGVMAVQDAQFGAALMALCGDWVQQLGCPLIASGMVGSRQGWKEAPYLDCPAGAVQAAQALTRVDIGSAALGVAVPGRTLHIVPGLRCREDNGQFDVMRGEETQTWGAGIAPGGLCVLPGTHSKWVWVGDGGQITHFRTYMTGELYGLLTQHGILGRLMVFGASRRDDFLAGVKLGMASHAHASHAIFSARTAGLLGSIAGAGLPDYLSGMLIGIELGSAISTIPRGAALASITLLGDDDLCDRYQRAFEFAGIATCRAADDATTAGQWVVASAAGLTRPVQAGDHG